MIEIKKKEGESVSSHLSRFSKKVKQSGVMKEMRKRKSLGRTKNKNARRKAAIYRTLKNTDISRTRKYGGETTRKNK
jgi:ribosomal protein S21